MSDKDVPPPEPADHRGMSRRQKQGIGGVLGILASAATILGTVSQCSHPAASPGPPPATVPAASTAYPAAAQQQYLTTCDNSGTATPAQCSCMMAWFMGNISYSRYQADNQLADEGVKPADLTSAQEACL